MLKPPLTPRDPRTQRHVRAPRLSLAEGAPAHLARELTSTFRDELETQRLPALSLPRQ